MDVELYDVSVLSHGCMKLWINWWIYEDGSILCSSRLLLDIKIRLEL